MNQQIKYRYTDEILFEGEYASILEALSAAIKLGANLWGANLEGANLRVIDLPAMLNPFF